MVKQFSQGLYYKKYSQTKQNYSVLRPDWSGCCVCLSLVYISELHCLQLSSLKCLFKGDEGSFINFEVYMRFLEKHPGQWSCTFACRMSAILLWKNCAEDVGLTGLHQGPSVPRGCYVLRGEGSNPRKCHTTKETILRQLPLLSTRILANHIGLEFVKVFLSPLKRKLLLSIPNNQVSTGTE